jgi:hypothetical protein
VSAREVAEKNSTTVRTHLIVPEGASFFKITKAGVRRIDIIPYEAGKGNPNADPGYMTYERTYYVHKQIGPDRKSYICPYKNSGKRCPICEVSVELKKTKDWKDPEVKALAVQKRQLFNVIDVDEPEVGIQIWDESHYLFGASLDDKVKEADPEDAEAYNNFYDPTDGLTVRIQATEEKMPGYKYYSSRVGLELKPRKKQYDDSILDDAYNLDDMIKELSYDKLKDIFLQAEPEDEEEEEEEESRPATRRAKPKPPEDEDEDEDEEEEEIEVEDEEEEEDVVFKKGMLVDHKTHGACTIVDVHKDGRHVDLKKANGYTRPGELLKDCSLIVEKEDEETGEGTKPKAKPKVKPKATPKKKPPVEEEDDDDDIPFDEDEEEEEVEDEDEEEEEETPRRKKK